MPRLKPSSRGVLLLYRQDRERVRTGQRAVWGVWTIRRSPTRLDVAAVGILPITPLYPIDELKFALSTGEAGRSGLIDKLEVWG